jgi:hypothetical protein
MDDQQIAQQVEHAIILANGISAPCGCSKLVMCPFPSLPWYYATLCRHDNDSFARALTPTMNRMHWWFDLPKGKMISSLDFTTAFHQALEAQEPPSVFALTTLPTLLRVVFNEKIFEVGSGGQVRRLHPRPRSDAWV